MQTDAASRPDVRADQHLRTLLDGLFRQDPGSEASHMPQLRAALHEPAGHADMRCLQERRALEGQLARLLN